MLLRAGVRRDVPLRLRAERKETHRFAMPPEVQRLHQDCGAAVAIGEVVFLSKEMAERSEFFAVELEAAVRWYAWNEAEGTVWVSDDDRATWASTRRSFLAFLQPAFEDLRRDEARHREKCVNGEFVPSPVLGRRRKRGNYPCD